MKVVIGNTNYEIKKISNENVLEKYKDRFEEYETLKGCVDYYESAIYINSIFPEQIRQQTIWHEVVHAMLEEIGAPDLSADEGFVDAFSKQIYGFIKNNKLDKLYEYVGGKDERIDKKNPS